MMVFQPFDMQKRKSPSYDVAGWSNDTWYRRIELRPFACMFVDKNHINPMLVCYLKAAQAGGDSVRCICTKHLYKTLGCDSLYVIFVQMAGGES